MLPVLMAAEWFFGTMQTYKDSPYSQSSCTMALGKLYRINALGYGARAWIPAACNPKDNGITTPKASLGCGPDPSGEGATPTPTRIEGRSHLPFAYGPTPTICLVRIKLQQCGPPLKGSWCCCQAPRSCGEEKASSRSF